MKKFELVLSRKGDDILAQRAGAITKLAEMAQEALVNNLEKEKIEIEMKKQEMLDMSPDNRYSLTVGENFKATDWTQEYQRLSLQLINLEIELKVAKETSADLFTEKAED